MIIIRLYSVMIRPDRLFQKLNRVLSIRSYLTKSRIKLIKLNVIFLKARLMGRTKHDTSAKSTDGAAEAAQARPGERVWV